MKPLSTKALEVLSSGLSLVGQNATIARQLDRKLYVEVNAALEALGGKWNKKAKAHIFVEDPADALERVLLDGAFHDAKRDLDQFFTPPELAEEIVKRAGVRGKTVLEPSAGAGALVLRCLEAGAQYVTCVERDVKLVAGLCKIPWDGSRVYVIEGDFLTVSLGKYERVVMNPPFSKRQDVAHVTRAFDLLAPGGRLVAVMSAGVEFRTDKLTSAFRAIMEAHGDLERLPEQSFKASGTDVRTVLVTLEAPR